MSRIGIEELKAFCRSVLLREGMTEADAATTAEVLVETDAFGVHSHGSKNLGGYINKAHKGGVSLHARPQIVQEGAAYAVIDACESLGMVAGTMGIQLACEKATESGVALVTVRNSCHFGAAGYYANLAVKQGMVCLVMSNVDHNMTVPGARGMVIGNNPVAYAAPAKSVPSVFLDIALSNVASLKVVQARRDGREIPSTWIVDKDGLPTTDPSHYPEEGAMQPMAAHKGYGLSVFVDLMCGILSGGSTSVSGEITSWCFDPEKVNKACHTFLVVNPLLFGAGELMAERVEEMANTLRSAEKAANADRIYVPGEIEWEKHRKAEADGIELPPEVESALKELSEASGVPLNFL